MKKPSLHVLAPTRSALVAQTVFLALFVVLGFFAVRKFHPAKFHPDLAPTA
ncbi:MAG: hypothetical protein WAM75_08900 [Xanthobacteraceae bacterium]